MNSGDLCRRGGLCAEMMFITGSIAQYVYTVNNFTFYFFQISTEEVRTYICMHVCTYSCTTKCTVAIHQLVTSTKSHHHSAVCIYSE